MPENEPNPTRAALAQALHFHPRFDGGACENYPAALDLGYCDNDDGKADAILAQPAMAAEIERLKQEGAATERERLAVEAGRDEWKRTHIHNYVPWPVHDSERSWWLKRILAIEREMDDFMQEADGHLTEVQSRCACGDRYLAEDSDAPR